MKTTQVISKDGVLLSCQCSGTGPPLVLVHGTAGTASRWTPVRPALQTRFQVCAMDRRGHGKSADTPAYSIQNEYQDIVAVVESCEQPASLIGHSYGGICALEATRLTERVRKLVLYEPPIPHPDVPTYSPGVVEHIEAFAAEGNREEILRTFLLDVVRMPPSELEAFQASPGWADRVAAAHTIPREMRAHELYRFNAEQFKNFSIPTLLLLGGDSPDFFKAGTALLHRSLPNSRVVVLPGQRHNAINKAPELFAREVITFLEE